MNCNLCKPNLEMYHKGNLPEGISVQVKAHLETCNDCNAIYQMEVIANRVILEEKDIQSNPFLATRVMAGIELLESRPLNSQPIPFNGRGLKPALVTISLAAAVFIGVLVGNIYQPVPDTNEIPVELTYMNDAALESVDLLSNI